jgi:hypothetical protein
VKLVIQAKQLIQAIANRFGYFIMKQATMDKLTNELAATKEEIAKTKEEMRAVRELNRALVNRFIRVASAPRFRVLIKAVSARTWPRARVFGLDLGEQTLNTRGAGFHGC